MAIPALYTDGTLSVEAAATAVTGQSTAWSTQLKRGTHLTIAGVTGVVASVEGDTALTLAAAWAGATAVEAAYVATTWNDGAEIAEAVRLMLERIVGRGMGIVVNGEPVASDLRDNDWVWSRTSGALAIKDQGVLTALLQPGRYDASGYTDGSPSDRDQYDDGQGDLAEQIGRGLTFFAINETGFYILLTTAVDMDPAVWSDLVVITGPAGVGDKYTIARDFEGRPKPGVVALRHVFEADVTFPADFAGALGSADTGATAETVWSITKNGVEVGTITFDDPADEAVFESGASPVAFEAGDVMRWVAPDPRDDTLADLSITLVGDRSGA